MPYLIRKGTTFIVRKPSGELVGHACKEDCLFQKGEKVSEHTMVQFQRGGFLVSVEAADVTEVGYRCPQCQKEVEIEGALRWVPEEVAAEEVRLHCGTADELAGNASSRCDTSPTHPPNN